MSDSILNHRASPPTVPTKSRHRTNPRPSSVSWAPVPLDTAQLECARGRATLVGFSCIARNMDPTFLEDTMRVVLRDLRPTRLVVMVADHLSRHDLRAFAKCSVGASERLAMANGQRMMELVQQATHQAQQHTSWLPGDVEFVGWRELLRNVGNPAGVIRAVLEDPTFRDARRRLDRTVLDLFRKRRATQVASLDEVKQKHQNGIRNYVLEETLAVTRAFVRGDVLHDLLVYPLNTTTLADTKPPEFLAGFSDLLEHGIRPSLGRLGQMPTADPDTMTSLARAWAEASPVTRRQLTTSRRTRALGLMADGRFVRLL